MQSYPVQTSFPVHWGEMDALGHVNHTRYLTWMETARLALFARVGLACQGAPEVGPILANINVDYRMAVRYPADILVGVRVVSVGNTSFVLEYAVATVDNPGESVAWATTVIVLVNYRTGKKVVVPDAIRAALGELGGAKEG